MFGPNWNDVMKFAIAKLAITAAALLIGATLEAEASAGRQGLACTAKVVHSEELPFAPIYYWLVNVTLVITPPNGQAFETTLQDRMPWQTPPPRRGQTFRLRCDPANPSDFHFSY
jgi:hypothetical protein